MSWEALGALGEVIGAVAVVFTLAFLAVQIRHGSRSIDQNNALAESEAVTRSVDLMTRFRIALVSDEKVADVWHRGTYEGDLEGLDLLRFRQLAMSWFEIMSAIYMQNLKNGRDDAVETIVSVQARNIYRSPGLRAVWEENPYLLDPARTGLKEAVEAEIERLEGAGT